VAALVFVKVARPTGPGGANERWAACEVCPTLNVFDNAGDVRAVVLIVGRRRKVKVKRSYGINTQNRSMYPCTLERSQTVAVCHQVATIVFGIKCNQSEKSQKPWSKDIAQCLSASCHDASVIMLRKKGLSE
jgi:hypothetical protein